MIKLTNDKLIKIKAICVYLEGGGFINGGGWLGFQVLTLGIGPQDVDGIYLFTVTTWDGSGTITNVDAKLIPGWRWRIDRLLETVPDNKPVNFWGWGVDSDGYVFPILGNNSDCERVQFVSPTPLDKE